MIYAAAIDPSDLAQALTNLTDNALKYTEGPVDVRVSEAGGRISIDVIDAGQFLRPKAFSGVLGCEGARKSVKFDLPARPLDIQLSGVRNGEISLIVSPE